MTRWLSALLAWCFVFLLVIEQTSTKRERRSRTAFAALMFATLVALAFSVQAIAGNVLPNGALVRVQLTGDAQWHEGHVRTIEDCRMVFLAQSTRDGYTSLMLNGAARLQISHGKQWQELSLQTLIHTEPLQCREMGSD